MWVWMRGGKQNSVLQNNCILQIAIPYCQGSESAIHYAIIAIYYHQWATPEITK